MKVFSPPLTFCQAWRRQRFEPRSALERPDALLFGEDARQPPPVHVRIQRAHQVFSHTDDIFSMSNSINCRRGARGGMVGGSLRASTQNQQQQQQQQLNKTITNDGYVDRVFWWKCVTLKIEPLYTLSWCVICSNAVPVNAIGQQVARCV